MRTDFSPNAIMQRSFVAVAIAGAGVAAGGLIGKGIARGKANKTLKGLQKEDPTYTKSPYAQAQLGLAQQMFSGRMAGAAQMQNNIYSNQGNTFDAVRRTATDSSQALAAISGAQGQTDQSLSNLQTMEAQNKYSMLGNLNAAYGQMIGEDDKAYGDNVRRFGNKVQIQGAINENRQNTWGDISNFGMSVAGLGVGGMGGGGGFGNMFPRRPSTGVIRNPNGGYTINGNVYSDIRLKENYHVVGKSPSGINIYEFSYKGNPKRFIGTMANEVPWATESIDGYLLVDYSKTDVKFKEL